MVFLIDYENVGNTGMAGTEELLPTDEVILFYSDAVHMTETRHLEDIQNSRCEFSVCKLQKVQKNALDFYISTKLGEIFGQGQINSAVIVSRDAGFQAVRDYWAVCAEPRKKVTLAESIERGIVGVNTASKRTEQVRAHLRNQDIGIFYAAYKEHHKFQKMLAEVFEGTEYADRLPEIEIMLREGKSPKVVYLASLRRFGRKDGLAVYNRLKECAGDGEIAISAEKERP